MKLLGTLPGYGYCSEAYAVNNSGQVVGVSLNLDNRWHPFFYDKGQMIDLGTLPGYASGTAYDINSHGQIVGDSVIVDSSTFSHGFIFDKGTMTDIGVVPGFAYETTPVSINDLGQVVGACMRSSDYLHHGFVYQNGTITDLNTVIDTNSGWIINEANGINNFGWIVGRGNQRGWRVARHTLESRPRTIDARHFRRRCHRTSRPHSTAATALTVYRTRHLQVIIVE